MTEGRGRKVLNPDVVSIGMGYGLLEDSCQTRGDMVGLGRKYYEKTHWSEMAT